MCVCVCVCGKYDIISGKTVVSYGDYYIETGKGGGRLFCLHCGLLLTIIRIRGKLKGAIYLCPGKPKNLH